MVSVLCSLLGLASWTTLCSVVVAFMWLKSIFSTFEQCSLYLLWIGFDICAIQIYTLTDFVYLLVTEKGILKFPTMIMVLSISSYNSLTVCFILSEAQLLSAYKFRIVVLSWWVTYWLFIFFLFNSTSIFGLHLFFLFHSFPFVSLYSIKFSSLENLLLLIHYTCSL